MNKFIVDKLEEQIQKIIPYIEKQEQKEKKKLIIKFIYFIVCC